MKNLTKKIGAVVGIGLMATLAACTAGTVPVAQHEEALKNLTATYDAKLAATQTTVDALQKQVESDKAVQEQLDLAKTDLATLQEQASRDAQVLADYKAELDKSHATQAAEQPSTVVDVQDDLSLDAAVTPYTLDNGDLEFLQDGQIRFNDDDYDVKEKITLNSDLKVLTSLHGDEDFEDAAALGFMNEGAIEYKFEFQDPINVSEISEDEPLDIVMLGKPLEIIKVTSNSFTVLNGQKITLQDNDKLTVSVDGEDHEIIASLITEGKVQLSVDGTIVHIDEGKSKSVNGISIRATDVSYTAKDTQRSMVELNVAKQDASLVVENGDEYVKDDHTFEWTLDVSGGLLNSIGVRHAERFNDADEKVIKQGEKQSFAGLFNLAFELEKKDYHVAEFKVDLDEATALDIPAVRVQSRDGKKIIVGDEELSEAWVNDTAVFYKNDHNDWVTDVVHSLVLENNDLSYTVAVVGNTVSIGPMVLDVQSGLTQFGLNANDAEATDLKVGATLLGDRDQDVLLADGTVVSAPQNDLDSDALSFKMPDEEVQAKIIVSK